MYDPLPPVTADVHDTGSNTVTGLGLGEHVTVNTFTVIVFVSVAVPPAPVQESVYVVVVDGFTVTEPDVAPPVVKFVPVHAVALAEAQVMSAD